MRRIANAFGVHRKKSARTDLAAPAGLLFLRLGLILNAVVAASAQVINLRKWLDDAAHVTAFGALQ